ncbi:MAG: IS3 family transposase [Bacteroidales bacterium]|nr:IS3 family transposase [Bacteroidales bacterium]
MRRKAPEYKMETLCGLFGKSRQAYYQQYRHNYNKVVKAEIILDVVGQQRKLMPRIGGRKLHHIIQNQLPEDLVPGRDKFFDLLRGNNLLVKRKRYKAKTTWSNHWMKKYPNLIRDFTPVRPHQLWVSDITYLETEQGFVYLFLITDAYSRKIVGWDLSDTLEAHNAVTALKMALRQLPDSETDIYHHSDRGSQYCSSEYVKLLNKKNFKISMTENGDPLENSIAERVNGILKTEWIYDLKLEHISHANKQISRIIKTYNNSRPHDSIERLTPNTAHQGKGELNRLWKNYYKKKVSLNI